MKNFTWMDTGSKPLRIKRYNAQLFTEIDPNAPPQPPSPVPSSAVKKLFKFLKYFGYFARIFF